MIATSSSPLVLVTTHRMATDQSITVNYMAHMYWASKQVFAGEILTKWCYCLSRGKLTQGPLKSKPQVPQLDQICTKVDTFTANLTVNLQCSDQRRSRRTLNVLLHHSANIARKNLAMIFDKVLWWQQTVWRVTNTSDHQQHINSASLAHNSHARVLYYCTIWNRKHSSRCNASIDVTSREGEKSWLHKIHRNREFWRLPQFSNIIYNLSRNPLISDVKHYKLCLKRSNLLTD